MALKVIDEVDRLRATAQGTGEFAKTFSSPPVLIGSSIWSKRSCVEIDMRDVRFEARELEVGRTLIATLVQQAATLMDGLKNEWEAVSHSLDFLTTPPDRVWWNTFHYAAAAIVFPAFSTRGEYMQILQEADAARLRLREDRETRYQKALEEIRAATEKTPWVEPTKPKTVEEAKNLLESEKAAFVYRPDDLPFLCFTKESLLRATKLEDAEFDDFVAELKRNKLIESRTHPISFAEGKQLRMIRVRAQAVTITTTGGENGVSQY